MRRIDIRAALKALKAGGVIVYPTDTLYALGADAYNKSAVEKVFSIKERPLSQPLPVAVASLDEMKKIVEVTPTAERVASRFLPGPLTIVLKRKPGVMDYISGGRDTLAVRIPKNDVALNLLMQVGPITVTSANIHDTKPLPEVSLIKKHFDERGKEIDVYLDAGVLNDVPSTIVDLSGDKWVILRKGSITDDMIKDAVEHG
ncbi:MAG: L-threonylcarbamoyladenylate synthase [Candidatus Thermoplasmatota archaeon]